jgi:hypothetical protein
MKKCNCPIGKKECDGMRKMSEKEKAVLKAHYDAKPHDKSQKRKMINAICRSKTAIDTNSKMVKLHKKIF